MNRHRTITAVAVLAICAAVTQAQTNPIRDMAKRTANSLAVVRCTFDAEDAVGRAGGMAFCIDSSGEFLSLAFTVAMRKAKVASCELIVPGTGGRKLKAKITGIDRETGVGFIRCIDPKAPKFTALAMDDEPDLSVGTRVISAGILPADVANIPYYGMAVICARMFRTPEPLVYVSAGNLTRIGSPVLSEKGRIVGIVWRQLPASYQMVNPRRRGGAASMLLKPFRETSFFLPITELRHVIDRHKAGGDTSWLGVTGFQAVDPDVLGTDRPAARIANVIPGQPAAKAGLKKLDVIVQINGKDLPKLASHQITAANVGRLLRRVPVGGKVDLTLFNGKKVSVTLTAMPETPAEARRYLNKEMGLIVREKALMEQYLPIKSAGAKGLLVLQVGKDSQAAKAGLRSGDLLTSIQAQPVATVATFKQVAAKALAIDGPGVVSLLVQRGEKSESITVRVPR